jgi:NAD(P)-dependent dehydrogenase (short-subunit alcohol dehydrogenase family)
VAFAGWLLGRGIAPRFSFANKVVLITGSSRGLGLVLARQLCAEGARVVLLARDRAELQRAHDELVQQGGDVSILPCDLTDRAQCEEAIRHVVQHYGASRRADQQRRHHRSRSARAHEPRRLRAGDAAASLGAFHAHDGGHSASAGAWRGPHREHLVDWRQNRRAASGALLRE